MILKKRLKAVENLIDNDSIVLDIGCDHAYLPISLILDNKSKKAYAVDNKIGPLNNALINIKTYNVESKVYPILSDGFKDINFNDFDTVTITGMGALNIIDILNDMNNVNSSNITFIFEANRDNNILRNYLSLNKFIIIDEDIVFEDDFYYFIIKAKKINEYIGLNNIEIEFGPVNIRNKNKILKDYILKMLSIYNNAIKNTKEENILLKNKINLYMEALNEIK